MLHDILTIYTKELQEVLRDKKTLIFMLLLPTLIFPLIFSITLKFASKAEEEAATESIGYAVFGGEQLPELLMAFEDGNGFERVQLGDPEQISTAIRQGDIKLALVIPDDGQTKLAAGSQVNLQLFYNNAAITSKVKERASQVIEQYSERQRDQRLAVLGVDNTIARENILEPITITSQGTASAREVMGAALGGLLPYMFVICCFLGALYPAIDLGAGEKERGTLETLLLAPVERNRIVLGKFLVIFTTGVSAALVSIASMGVWLYTKGQSISGQIGEAIKLVSNTDLLLVASMLIPIAALLSALLLSISIYAKNFKEAQSYATPLNFLIIIPAFLAMLPGVELTWGWAMVPITNIALAIKELIKGTMDYHMMIAILGSSTLFAGGMLSFCTQWFKREDVLFRQ